jgi:nucleotide-binding universal stress UspA family protein
VRRGAEVAQGSDARVHLVTVYPDIPSYKETMGSVSSKLPQHASTSLMVVRDD